MVATWWPGYQTFFTVFGDLAEEDRVFVMRGKAQYSWPPH
jgi:hypothetical protein